MKKKIYYRMNRKARKPYICFKTGKAINVGDTYRRIQLKYAGVYHYHISVARSEIRQHLIDKGILMNKPYTKLNSYYVSQEFLDNALGLDDELESGT